MFQLAFRRITNTISLVGLAVVISLLSVVPFPSRTAFYLNTLSGSECSQSPCNCRFHLFVILVMMHYITCFLDVIYVFVVNECAVKKNTVEKFRFDEKRRVLCHLRTYRDPTFMQSVFLTLNIVCKW